MKPLRFLPGGASPTELIRAAASNHIAWFVGNALAAGGEVHQTNGVTWTVTAQEMIIAFPELNTRNAGQALDILMHECFQRKPERAGCWSLTPFRPRDLGARLAARGFEWGWCPHWMALDLQTLPAELSVPDGIEIAVNDGDVWDVDDLPYYNRNDAPHLRAMANTKPRRAYNFGAYREGKVVGQSMVYLTTGHRGIAGIYNVGVVPAERHQGIGSAITLAACHHARSLGCRYALLNSAANALYEGLGFVSLGLGQSWWMPKATLAGSPPTPAQIRFAEAIGQGDIATLDALSPAGLPEDFDSLLPNGTTPMQLAVQCRKPRSAKWLAAQGATLDILSAWDLGWKTQARKLLAVTPELANRRSGNMQITPVHEAIMRDDMPLFRLLLSAKPDLTIQDTQFQGTPLGWAKHFGRTEMIALLEQ